MEQTKEQNNLKSYLEHQIKEYQEECENLKALYADLQEHIEECKVHIRSLKAKEDVGFSLLSPIAVDSAYQSQIDRTKAQQEAFEKQKEKYLSDIRFYEGKIEEMQIQLEEYQKVEKSKKQQVTLKEQNVAVSEQENPPVEQTEKEEAVEIQTAENNKEHYAYILHKLSEIKGYMKVDAIRGKLELEQLESYINKLMR